MTVDVYKIDESPTRSIILVREPTDNKFYPVNTTIVEPITIITGSGGAALGPDLVAIEALNGTNTIYYRSAADTWSPVVIGSGLNFGGGILSFTGVTGGGSVSLDADLISLAAASSTNAIYYRSAADTWSPVTIGGGLSFAGGSLNTGAILDDDLVAIAALNGTNTIYYRSAANTWSPITISSGISFAGGILSLTGTSIFLDGDLNALAALNGTNTLYYRSATDTWSPVTIGTGLSFSAGTLTNTGTFTGLDGDLNALAALNGTNTIYYRSATDTWTPVTIGTGLSFSAGTLTNTGVFTGLDADLQAIAALTNTNSIFYRASDGVWSPVTFANLVFSGGVLSGSGGSSVSLNTNLTSLSTLTGTDKLIYYNGTTFVPASISTGINFSGGILNINKDSYCLEGDIGLIPWNYDTPIMTWNTQRLNDAMDAMCPSGQFRFMNGIVGPIQKKIRAAGKTFYFNGILRTNLNNGGTIEGEYGGAAIGDGEFCIGCQGGSHTRFVRTNGAGIPDEFVFLLRNNAFKLKDIQFFGAGTPGNINTYTGTRISTVLGIEGRANPPAGGHTVDHCSFAYGITGIRFMNGYYSGSTFISDENHADTSHFINCDVLGADVGLSSNNQQALWNKFDLCNIAVYSGGTILDMQRGGLWEFRSLGVSSTNCTLLKVKDFNPNICRFDIHFYRDGYGISGQRLKLFDFAYYDGSGAEYQNYQPETFPNCDWNVKFQGSIGNENEISNLGEIARFNGATSSKIWFDINNIEHFNIPSGYEWEINGPSRRLVPTGTLNFTFDNLVAYYPLTDNAASTTITATIGSTGTYIGGNTDTKTASGPNNILPRGLSFNGTSDYITTNAGAILRNGSLNNLTFAGWVYFNAAGRNDFLVWKNAGGTDDLSFILNGSNKLEFYSALDGAGSIVATSNSTLTTGVWYFVGITKLVNTWTIYLNGVQDGDQGTLSQTLSQHDTDVLWLGSNHSAFSPLSDFNLNGRMSNWSIWNRALTANQMLELYRSGKGLSYPFTILYSG